MGTKRPYQQRKRKPASKRIANRAVVRRANKLAEQGVISGQARYYIVHGRWPKRH
jgi:hypothetical protein